MVANTGTSIFSDGSSVPPAMAGGTTTWVLGDQLSHDNPALEGADRVLLVESRAKLGAGRRHRQKLHLVLSAMRHFARELRERGFEVDHRSAQSLSTGLRSHVDEHRPERVRLLRPDGSAPINAVEGFVRQVIGWREYVWGTYWHFGHEWASDNALEATGDLPAAFRDPSETDMRCLSDTVRGVSETGYAHHIQRLMVLGNLTMLLGVDPREIFDWFHESFVDGYDWVMAPNVLAMATWADGGRMFTKPYAAGGRYVDRMSDYCGSCRYDPSRRTGDDACPYSTLYWDFLDRNRRSFADVHRMRMPLRTLERMGAGELAEVRRRGRGLRRHFDA